MTQKTITYYGKEYKYDRSFRLKKDAEFLARDWERDGDKVAIVRQGWSLFGSKSLGTYEVKRTWGVYWRRK